MLTPDTEDSPIELRAESVTVRFGGLTALDQVSMALRPKQILGLIGPNGAGKTTLVNVLSGFQTPQSGVVSLDARDMTGAEPAAFARAGIVRTFQAVRLFKGLTLSENIEVSLVSCGAARAQARRQARDLLAEFELDSRAAHEATALSYGEQRRAGLVRALAMAPQFLLLDEPAAGLAAAEAEELRQTIVKIAARSGAGILVIEHNVALVINLCHQIHVLASGRTIAEGTPAAIMADPAVRAAYLGPAAAA